MTHKLAADAMDRHIRNAKLNMELESPFKHLHQHQLIVRSNYSNVLKELYQFTINLVAHNQEPWVSTSDDAPFGISLKLETIQESVREGKCLDTDCFNLAVRNMLVEDAKNLQNTKCLGWRHHVYQDWAMYAIRGDEYWDTKFTGSWFSFSSTAYDAFSSHLVLVPVLHAGHWTLYAFNMCDRKLSILDSLARAGAGAEEERHRTIRLKICGALNQTMGRPFDWSEDDTRRWEVQFPRVPKPENSCDCGFFVFNFMRLWDGHKLVQSFSTKSEELRADFLAYILSSCKDNNQTTVPLSVASWIHNLSERKNVARKCRQDGESYDDPMDSKLLKAVMQASEEEFRRGFLDSNDSDANSSGDMMMNTMLIRLRGVASAGDGVLHIAARHGREDLLLAIFIKARVVEPPAAARNDDAEIETGALSSGLGRLVRNILCTGAQPPPDNVSNNNADIEMATQGRPRADEPRVTRNEGHDEQAPVPAPASACNNDAETTQHQQLRFAEFLRARNQKGETCLHEAVRFGSKSLVDLLMAVDASLNDATTPALVQILDHQGVSPLYLATTLRRVDIMESLTGRDYKYCVSHGGPDGKTALHAAVLLSNELCELLLKWNKSLARSTDELGRTPLHYLLGSTTTRDTVTTTETILYHDKESGYCADSEGRLPIHVAAASRHGFGIIKKLLEKCPDCSWSCNAAGQTFLHVAVGKPNIGVVRCVCTEPTLSTILNTRDQNGDTALHLAIRNGCRFTFSHLLANKEVRLSLTNNQGRTPLDVALLSIKPALGFTQHNREWILNDLLAAGADFSTYRVVDPSISSNTSDDTSEDDDGDEKEESERLSKTAGLFGAAALLILTSSFQLPFNGADKKLQSAGKALDPHVRERIFARLVRFDVVSLAMSALSIFFFSAAAFPVLGRGIAGRHLALLIGISLLHVASAAILVVFAHGLSLLYIFPGWCGTVFSFTLYLTFSLTIALIGGAPSSSRSFIALQRRRGIRRCFQRLYSGRPEASPLPLQQAVFLLFNYTWLAAAFLYFTLENDTNYGCFAFKSRQDYRKCMLGITVAVNQTDPY